MLLLENELLLLLHLQGSLVRRLNHLRFAFTLWLRQVLDKPGGLLIIHLLLLIPLSSELTHELCIEKVVHGPYLLKELLVIQEVYRWKDPLECPSSLKFFFCLFEDESLLSGQLRYLLRL